ncbi:hypothetical protein F5890DRAFT_1532756 [Lentinula detonsa]|uniref:Uncharacterized protein n=1 Tax=Lentinula detonsa TaxID=2804962 RepID=A0AA38PUK6_9AGAR|nr:hypothetical protein F5890DRAFT_1532756 [Lentinula detonsa]
MTVQASYIDSPNLGGPSSALTPGLLTSRRRYSHRYTQSAPPVVPLPSLSSSSTSISSRIANFSNLTTPISDSYDEYPTGHIVPSVQVATGNGSTLPEVDQQFDIPTPKASPRRSSRIPVLLLNRQKRFTVEPDSGDNLARVCSKSKSTLHSSSAPTNSVRAAVRSRKPTSISDSPIAPHPPLPTILPTLRAINPSRPSPIQCSLSKPTLAISVASPHSLSSHSQHSLVRTSPDAKMDIGRPHSYRRYSPSESSTTVKGSALFQTSCTITHSTSLYSSQFSSSRTSSHLSSPNTDSAETPQSMTLAVPYAPHYIHNHASIANSTLHKPLKPSYAAERMLRSTLARDEAKVSSPSSTAAKHRRHSSATPVKFGNSPESPNATLKPHEQVLRARLERVLLASAHADRRFQEESDDYLTNEREFGDIGRKRSRSRAGSDTSFLGWFWSQGSPGEDGFEEEDDDAVRWTASNGNICLTTCSQSVPLPVPSITPPHIQAFSQTPYFTHFTSPQQPALPVSSSASPLHSPRMRSYTSPVPSSLSAQNSFQSCSHSPRPQHAFSLQTISSCAEEHSTHSANIAESNSQVALGQEQMPTASRMPTPPPTPPPHHIETSSARLESQEGNRRGTLASNRQNPPRRSSELLHTGRHMSTNNAGQRPPLRLTPPTTSASATEAKNRRQSTPVSGFVHAAKSVDRRRSIPTSTGAALDPRYTRDVDNCIRQSPDDRVTQRTAARTQQSSESPKPMHLSSSLPSSSSSSHLQNPHRLSTPATAIPTSPSPPVCPTSSITPFTSTPPSMPPLHSSLFPHPMSSFNAQTASMRCREFDGYVSFAAVAGLEEPNGDDEGSEGREESCAGDGNSAANLGWVGRLFGGYRI